MSATVRLASPDQLIKTFIAIHVKLLSPLSQHVGHHFRLRLCRLMCGKSPSPGQGYAAGYAPDYTRGSAPIDREHARWGIAATAHQAAEPHFSPLLPHRGV